MSVISVRAKVLLTKNEDQLEIESKYDIGNVAGSKEWVWRRLGLPVEEIYKIIEYSKTQSIIELNNEERILIMEDYDSLFTRWKELKDFMSSEEGIEEVSEEEAGEEDNSEDDDED